ncbi:MAG: hypothetical protein V1724_05215 [Chloroflexota bacterium]
MTTKTEETTNIMLRQIREVERMDEEQILAELQGDPDIVRDLVYSFGDRGGRAQKGLSYAGTREVLFMRGNIRLAEPVVTEHPDYSAPDGGYIRAMSQATDLERNISIWGGVHQPYNQWVWLEDEETARREGRQRKGGYQQDPHVFEKAIAKAQRNAIKNVLPASVIKAIIQEWDRVAKGGKGRAAGRAQGQPAPGPRIVDPKTGEIVEEKSVSEAKAPPKPARDLATITSLNTWQKACFDDFGLQPAQAAERAGYGHPSDIATIEALRQAYQQIAAVYSNNG